MKIKENPDSIPKEHVHTQRNFTAYLDTAKADCVVWNEEGIKGLSIIAIFNSEEGNGNASKLINELENYAKELEVEQIWFPTVINPRLIKILIKKGYHPEDKEFPEFGRIVVFVKELKTNG